MRGKTYGEILLGGGILAFFGMLLVFMLFYKLDAGYLIQTDEAYHATNAYEMYKSGNWVVNTYRYETDYFNSKPPLCLDLMKLSYKIFGVSGFSARFPSALGGLLTAILVVVFFIYCEDLYSAAFFLSLLCACSDLFIFHMYRAAEMDSFFNLFFAAAMISLVLMEKRPQFMLVYGISLGLAFMCKGPHAALIFFVGLLYIPRVRSAFSSVKRVIVAVILAVIIPAIWMLVRVYADGWELFKALFLGEVVGRVSDARQKAYLPVSDYVSSNIFIIFLVIAVFYVIMSFVSGLSAKEIWKTTKEFIHDNYLYLLWIVVPVAFFSLMRSYMGWYGYTSQIATCMLTAKLISLIVRTIGKDKLYKKVLIMAVMELLALYFIVPCVKNNIIPAGKGGHPVDQFTNDIKGLYEEYGYDYAKVNAYLIPAWTVLEEDDGHWEPEYVAPAEMYCDLEPVDGTIDDFLNDQGSILILDKNLWDEYAPVLIGHVILYDNSYLIFSSDMY